MLAHIYDEQEKAKVRKVELTSKISLATLDLSN